MCDMCIKDQGLAPSTYMKDQNLTPGSCMKDHDLAPDSSTKDQYLAPRNCIEDRDLPSARIMCRTMIWPITLIYMLVCGTLGKTH